MPPKRSLNTTSNASGRHPKRNRVAHDAKNRPVVNYYPGAVDVFRCTPLLTMLAEYLDQKGRGQLAQVNKSTLAAVKEQRKRYLISLVRSERQLDVAVGFSEYEALLARHRATADLLAPFMGNIAQNPAVFPN